MWRTHGFGAGFRVPAGSATIPSCRLRQLNFASVARHLTRTRNLRADPGMVRAVGSEELEFELELAGPSTADDTPDADSVSYSRLLTLGYYRVSLFVFVRIADSVLIPGQILRHTIPHLGHV